MRGEDKLFTVFFIGIKCAVLEKNKNFSNHPQAHFINNRSMEVGFLTWEMSLNELLGISWFILTVLLLGVSQIGWPCRGDTEVSTTSRVMEKVHLLYFTLWFCSWFS